MKQLPIFLNLKARHCLVIGGDHAAQCKVELLLSAGALIHLNADSMTTDLRRLLRQGKLTYSKAPIETVADTGYSLVIIAECDEQRAAELSSQCKSLGIPVNAVDHPALCSFTVPSIVDRDPITIAVGTGGSSPVVARRIRAQIDRLVPRTMGPLTELLGRYRAQVANKVSFGQRRLFWEKVIDGAVGSQAMAGDIAAAEKSLLQILNNPSGCAPTKMAEVFIVDARHNTPELMTLEAVQALHRADHIVHESDIHPGVIALGRRDAQRHAEHFVSYMNTTDLRALCERLETLAAGRHNVVFLASNALFDAHTRQTIQRQLVASGVTVRDVQGIEASPYLERQVS